MIRRSLSYGAFFFFFLFPFFLFSSIFCAVFLYRVFLVDKVSFVCHIILPVHPCYRYNLQVHRFLSFLLLQVPA